MIQLLQTSWEDRFRVSRKEGRALGSLLGWFSLRRPALQSSFNSSSAEGEGGRDGAKLTRPSAKGLKKKQDIEDPGVLQLLTTHPHTHPPPHTPAAWLQKSQCPRTRKHVKAILTLLLFPGTGLSYTQDAASGRGPVILRHPCCPPPTHSVTLRVRPAKG